MLKRINVNQLTLGMHLTEFCGSWMEHPFWRTAFVLTDATDIEAILASSIKEVWIDCEKGLDVAAGETAVSEAESEAQVEAELKLVADGQRQIAPVSAAAEIERATKICQQAKQAVVSMFEEARMGNTVDVGGAELLVEEISDSVSRNPGALISLARLKTVDDYTYMHSVAVCAMMVALAKQLGLDEAQTRSAGLAGLLHDLGKALMPMAVLNKPGKLTDAEFTIIKSHPVEGHKMLLVGVNVDPMVLDVCLHHHEKTDGSGYPRGLKGDEISLFSKMGAVCDVYDAITSNRPYKLGWDPAESLRKMAEWTSGHFDPTVFQAFVKSMGIYPVGSLVRLTSGRIGVVVEQTAKSLTTPRIKVFFSTKSNMRILPQVIDLSHPDTSEKIAGREDPAKWHFPDLNELWSGLPKAPW
ncbi:MAG: HD-GYP domain-containing protein [Rhodoferax sp.]|uniref:HD-GYP domain-containing protein n=1 Tax=Rhodoferax sp. TaxID=50421 RepID=UPI001825CBF5|nr:HD-GYP domain-containing protein [Rhodoferax sp.]NMM13062.1 HD-GYP domain-containing protein [Rhodoferax sp.]NMM19340.1 HD-GYP domain-containing protein [Rhodoferax sp.]